MMIFIATFVGFVFALLLLGAAVTLAGRPRVSGGTPRARGCRLGTCAGAAPCSSVADGSRTDVAETPT